MQVNENSKQNSFKQILSTSKVIGVFTLIALLVFVSEIHASTELTAGHDFAKMLGSKNKQHSCLICHVEDSTAPKSKKKVKALRGKHENMYTMYTTINGNRGNLSGNSKLCLSCHDGITASDSVNMQNKSMQGLSLGMDLTNDHPVGVAFPPRNRKGTLVKHYFSQPKGKIKVYGTNQKRVECSSCHDPHGGSRPNMLRETMTGSKLCLQCHDK